METDGGYENPPYGWNGKRLMAGTETDGGYGNPPYGWNGKRLMEGMEIRPTTGMGII